MGTTHPLDLILSNIVFLFVAYFAKRYRTPVVLYVALSIFVLSTTYHAFAFVLPRGDSWRSYANWLDWAGCCLAVLAAGYHVGWKLMGATHKILCVAVVIGDLMFFAYSMSGDFAHYCALHSAFHVFSSLPMLMFIYFEHRYRLDQQKPLNGEMCFWNTIGEIKTRTTRDMMHISILYAFMGVYVLTRRSGKRALRYLFVPKPVFVWYSAVRTRAKK